MYHGDCCWRPITFCPAILFVALTTACAALFWKIEGTTEPTALKAELIVSQTDPPELAAAAPVGVAVAVFVGVGAMS